MADKLKNVKKRLLEILADRALAFFGVFFVSSTLFVCLMYSADLRIDIPWFILVYFALMLVGYLLQSLCCRICKYSRPEDTLSYEALEKNYHIKLAIPVLAVGVFLGFLVIPSVREYMMHLSQTVTFPDVYYYDENSFIPYLATVFIAAGFAAGSFAWFFRGERILTGRSAVVCLIFMALSIFLSFNLGDSAAIFQSVNIIGFTCCWLFAMNGQALRKTLASEKAPRPGADVIGYNTGLTAILLVAALLLLGLLFVVMSGIKTLFTLFFATLLASGEGKDGWSMDPDQITSSVNQTVFGDSVAARTSSYWYMLITIFILVSVLILFLSRRTLTVQQLFTRLAEFIRNLIAAFLNPIKDFFDTDTLEDDGFVFLDEVEKVRQRDIVNIRREKAARTWHEFLSEYRGKKTPEERYRYAYAEYVTILRRNRPLLKTSDTPRQTAKKLTEQTAMEETRQEIATFTDAFEREEFACLPADEITEQATNVLLREIKHYLQ